MRNKSFFISFGLLLTLTAQTALASIDGWLNWRGPEQTGVSRETGLVSEVEIDGKNHLWSVDLSGRGTPVIANGRLYTMGYRGEGPDLQEILLCADAETGKTIWEFGFNDYLSDIIYLRYAIGSPTVDRETGNIYVSTTCGEFACFNPDGKQLWTISMMEKFGRLTFPNGRTGAVIIDDDLVIVRGITANWGKEGPARDRFYAFDKITGELVWRSTPGTAPKDSSFSTPIMAWYGGKRVFYAGTGCGNVVCVNARTGEPLWRYHYSYGGVNSSIVKHDDKLIVIHGRENLDNSEIGRMIALSLNGTEDLDGKKQKVLDVNSELWRLPLCMFTSSPVLVGDKVYQVVQTGDLYCIDVNSGKVVWKEKLSNAQLHASPLYADGKLYIPMKNGLFYIVKPGDTGIEVLTKIQLEGNGLGSPSAWNGKVYVHSTEKLYCFGKAGDNPGLVKGSTEKRYDKAGKPARLQIVPNEVLLTPNTKQDFKINVLDSNGFLADTMASDDASWEKFIPATAKVKSKLKGDFNDKGTLVIDSGNDPSAGAFKATADNLTGVIRGRVVPEMPFSEDFESFDLNVTAKSDGGKFSYPPLSWIGGRLKWEIRELEGNKVLAKTLDRVLFQRALTFIGHPDSTGYTVEADVMTDGNRRMMSNVGVINQRYIVALIGNWQQLEVSSNHDRIKVSVPFSWRENVWYRIKTRVDLNDDGSGVVRAKAWKRSDPEPKEWTIEVPHKIAHKVGAPGLIGFSPQSQFKVFVDNVSVTKSK